MENEYVTLIPSGSYNTTFSTETFVNQFARGAVVTVDVQTITAGGLSVALEGKDRVSNKYRSIISSSAIIAPSTATLIVYPGLTAATGVVNNVLPESYRLTVTMASGTAVLTAGASLIG